MARTAIGALAALVLPLAAPAQEPAASPKLAGSRPNILFLFSDDHACHAISAYGSRINQTPNIDRIAADGVLFSNNFCGNSLCGPSRATILTGLHSHANGFMRNGNTFDSSQTTFASLLHDAGYQTAVIGKWHLESDPVGFDHWMVLPGQGQYYNPDFLTKDGRVHLEGHVTDLTTDLALRWLDERDPKRPFLLMCQHKAPHRNWMAAPEELGLYRDGDIPEPPTLFDDYQGRAAPAAHTEMTVANHLFLQYDLLVPPTEAEHANLQGEDRAWDGMRKRMTEAQRQAWDAAFAQENAAFRANPPEGKERVRWQYQRYIKNYLRCVAGVDRNIGRMLAWLDAHPDVKANTLVVYSSDQGFYLGDHGWYDKRWMYEESLRMPLVVSWPGHVAAGQAVAQLTQNIDFAPTFLELAGVPVPAKMQGQSLVPLLEGREVAAWRDAIYYHYYESQAVHMVPEQYGVRTQRFKLVRYYEPQWDTWELFDLASDPHELRNVADDERYAVVKGELQQRLTALRQQYHDDTGVLGDGAFAVTAGIAKAVHEGGAWRVWANATGGYLLHTGARAGTTTLTTTMTSVAGRQLRNGFVLATGGEPRHDLVRAGIEFGARRLTVVGPGGMRERKSVPVPWDGRSPVEVRVVIDLGEHRLTAEALGARVEVELPEAWQQLGAWGYGASLAETVFTELVLQ
ncbi:MAG TPA: sulfatase [Planctomycetota bacterium]|nr:sulfatase [Planctomycetota bacterium]